MLFRLVLVSVSFLRPSLARIVGRAPTPQTLDIPVTLDENQIYSVGVNMSSSSPQAFRFALSTSTGLVSTFIPNMSFGLTSQSRVTTVAGSNCDSCDGVPSYDMSASTSVKQTSQWQSVLTLNGTANGTLVLEDCGLLTSNGSAWAYPNQTGLFPSFPLMVLLSCLVYFSHRRKRLGMAPFTETPAAGWLSRNPVQANFSYGMALNPPGQSSQDGGVLHWLKPDESSFEGPVSYKPISSSPSNTSDWFVDMDAWSVSGGSPAFNVSRSGAEMPTLLDPYYASIVFPQSAARSLYAGISGASARSSTAYSSVYILPCSTNLRLSVTFGGFTTSLDQSSLIKKQGTICVGVIEEWRSSATTEYLLGSTFIAALYLIFIISQSGDGTIGFAQRVKQSSTQLAPGAVAGVVLGTIAIVALLAIAAVLTYFIWKKRSQRRSKELLPTPFRSNFNPWDVSQYPNGGNSQNSQNQGLLQPGAMSNPTTPDWQTTRDGALFIG
ncbi:aspartic peptidase domain-containing protein [Mycena rebaudengoi]|nr:aspartic peptidase domain-containing protein [Mycena rebaudengoi]